MRSRISIWLLGVVNTTDLAVIFSPAVLSHPDYELQPKEHKLSREVLEFLIAHQDWFILDISQPPPTGRELAGEVGQPRITRRTITRSHSSKSPHPPHREFSTEQFFLRSCLQTRRQMAEAGSSSRTSQ